MQSVSHVEKESRSRLRDSSALKCMLMAQRRGAERTANLSLELRLLALELRHAGVERRRVLARDGRAAR